MSGPNRLGLSYKDIFLFLSLSPSFLRKKLDRVKEFINNLLINKNKLKLIKSPRENFLPCPVCARSIWVSTAWTGGLIRHASTRRQLVSYKLAK